MIYQAEGYIAFHQQVRSIAILGASFTLATGHNYGIFMPLPHLRLTAPSGEKYMSLYFLLLVLAFAVINCVRGRGWLNKFVCYALEAVFLTLIAYLQGIIPGETAALAMLIIGMAGYTYGYLHCWGKYFPTPTDTSAQVCVRLVDKITTAIYGPYTSTTPIPQALNWKTIGMSWRFMIFFSPLNLGVCAYRIYMGTPAADMLAPFIITVLLLALVGPIYRICFYICEQNPAWQQYNVALSEVFTGAVLGVCACVIT